MVLSNSKSMHTRIQNSEISIQGLQHGVRIEAVFASLQQGEHMVKSMQFPAYIQSSRQLQE